MEEILLQLGIFTIIFGVAYLFFTTRHRERMALIEKGVDASLFKTGKKDVQNYFPVNLGLLSLGVGLGVLIGFFLQKRGMDESVAYTSSIFICGGLSLLSSFFIVKKMNQN